MTWPQFIVISARSLSVNNQIAQGRRAMYLTAVMTAAVGSIHPALGGWGWRGEIGDGERLIKLKKDPSLSLSGLFPFKLLPFLALLGC